MSLSPPHRSDAAYDEAQQVDIYLLRRVQARDAQALDQLYDRYNTLVFTIALRVVTDAALAEEVMQDVFLRCWNGAAQYEAERGRVATWLMAMARNRAIDTLRGRQQTARKRESVPMLETPGPTPFVQAPPSDEPFLRDAVKAALTTLSDSQREAIELAFYGGMSQSEIATEVDAPLGTVKSRIRDGMARLRHALQGWSAQNAPEGDER